MLTNGDFFFIIIIKPKITYFYYDHGIDTNSDNLITKRWISIIIQLWYERVITLTHELLITNAAYLSL